MSGRIPSFWLGELGEGEGDEAKTGEVCGEEQ